jgi:hypothetical protein
MMSESIYALLIGAGFYFPNMTETGATFPSLQGCVRDITRVEKELLIGRLQVPPEHILTLKASEAGKDKPDEPPEQWPTYDNIVAKFQELINMAQPGSQVYIHYSGHGGRATSRYKEVKGQDGIDETIVPIDIQDVAASRYLRDLELARLLKVMADKGLAVTLVLDCCHSGGLTRGGGQDIAVRGGMGIDTYERPRDKEESLVAPHAELIRNWREMSAAATRSITASSGWLPEPTGYVMLAACKENELAVEYAFNGTGRSGALTYWLLHALQEMGPGFSWKQVHDRILGKINSQFVRQTPQLEGEAGRQVFGLTQIPPVYAVRVLQYDSAHARVELNTGQALGAAEGAGFAIFPANSTDFTKVKERLAVAEITQLGATQSWARITESITPLNLQGGEQAVLIDSGVTAVRGQVRLVEEPPPPPAPERMAALQAVEDAMTQHGRGFLVKVGKDKTANYQVAISKAGEFEILDAQGTPFTNLRPALTISDPGAAEKVVGRLKHLYKYHTVEQLRNPDIVSPLAGALTVKAFKAPPEAVSFVAPPQPPEPLDSPGGTPLVTSGDRIYVLIKNNSALDLNIAMLDLDSNWGIAQVLPPASYNKDTLLLESKKELWPVMNMKIPQGYNEGRDTLKVFATIGSASFRFLELPALDQQFQSLRSKGRTARGVLEQLLAAFNDDMHRTRNASLEVQASAEWVVGEVTLHIRQP